MNTCQSLFNSLISWKSNKMIRLVLEEFNQLSIYRPFNKCSNKIAVLNTKLVNISRAIHCNLWGYLSY